MPRSRFVRPSTRVLTLADGDTLVVRDYLNAGEYRRMLSSMARDVPAESPDAGRIDPLKYPVGLIVAYVLDWNLTDADGRPVVIRDQPAELVAASVEALFPDSQVEIRRAIESHVAEMLARREAEKKTQDGATVSSPTSRSPSVAVGVMNG